MDGHIHGQTNGWIDGQTCMDGQMDGWTDDTHGKTNGWMEVDEEMDGWMDGWMDNAV